MEALYEADVRGVTPTAILDGWSEIERVVPTFTRELVEGLDAHLDEVDAVIERRADDWALDRMPAVDRSVLRVACFELLHRPDVPTGAIIDEAVEAAKELSTAESGRFVNGVLGMIAREDAGRGPLAEPDGAVGES